MNDKHQGFTPDLRHQPRIEYLDGLRGFAVSLVVLYHACKALAMFYPEYEYTREWIITRYGLMGVELFFMISGFVILMTLERCENVQGFLRKRWIRLFPAMVFATVITLLIINITPVLWWNDKGSLSVIPGLLFLDDRWLSFLIGKSVKPLDGAYWTIFTEVRFYLFFGSLYFLWSYKVAICSLVVLAVAYLMSLYTNIFFEALQYSDLHFSAWFAAGALFYKFQKTKSKLFLASAVLCGFMAAWSFFPSHGPRLFGAALVVLFALCGVSERLRSLFSSPVLLWLGAISYPLYLVHTRIIEAIYRPAHWFTSNLVILFVLPIATAVLISWLIAMWGEPWLRAQLQRFVIGINDKAYKRDFSGQPPI